VVTQLIVRRILSGVHEAATVLLLTQTSSGSSYYSLSSLPFSLISSWFCLALSLSPLPHPLHSSCLVFPFLLSLLHYCSYETTTDTNPAFMEPVEETGDTQLQPVMYHERKGHSPHSVHNKPGTCQRCVHMQRLGTALLSLPARGQLCQHEDLVLESCP
jgi:hypothetical protein